MRSLGLALITGLVAAGQAAAQPGLTTVPLQVPQATPAAPTYGYQPYDPGNPRGFYHPNNMGYGAYQNPTKLEGHRSTSLKYRRFRGF